MSESLPRDVADAEEQAWRALLAWRQCGVPAAVAAAPPAMRGAAALLALYRPLIELKAFAIAHLAQSLDGRIACLNGASRWLSGEEDLVHTHRMRALADAVLVGAHTIAHDDPQLTVRRCEGNHPVRVVIDPDRRLGLRHRVFRDGAAPTLLIVAACGALTRDQFGEAEILPLPRGERGIDPHAIRAALARRGLTRLFIEGGGITISHFLVARALDRLQLTIAPVVLGSGRPSLVLPEIAEPAAGLRPKTRSLPMGRDLMVECLFDG